MPEPPLIAADTNVLLDYAREDETVVDCFDTLKGRLPSSPVIILPTVIHELADLAEEGETERVRQTARRALESVLNPWGFQPVNCVPVAHGIIEQIACRLKEKQLLPETEINDSYIVAEAGLLGISILLSSDRHLKDIPHAELRLVMDQADVRAPLIASRGRLFTSSFGDFPFASAAWSGVQWQVEPDMNATRPLSRRGFLKQGAIGAAAAWAAPMILPGSVLGAEGTKPPSERLAIGIIGTGKMAHDYHLSTLCGFKDAQVVAVCDVDATRREHARKYVEDRYAKAGRDSKGCAAYNHFRDVLARKDIDAVLIATPDHWHAIPILEACRAGKDVYCEKPLTLTIREAQLCIEAVRKHQRVFQTGSQQRSSVFGQFRLACELIRSGRIGKVKTVRVGVGGPSRWCDLPEEAAEPGLDWDLWLGPAPLRAYHSALSPRGMHNHFPVWRSYREYSGGGLTDMGAHHFDIAQWALDMDQSGPVEIIPPEDPKASSGARYVYANGVEMIHGGPSGCTFEGTDGKLYIDRGKLTSEPEAIVKEPLGEKDVHLYRSPGHHRDWIDCIRSRKRPVADVEIGARSVTVCHLGNLAYWHRRKLRWDAQAWRFIGDDEANQWLDRPRRDPWRV